MMVICMRVRLAICLATHVDIVIVSDTHDALVSFFFFTDLGDRSWETAIRSIRRTALAIRAKKILIATADIY